MRSQPNKATLLTEGSEMNRLTQFFDYTLLKASYFFNDYCHEFLLILLILLFLVNSIVLADSHLVYLLNSLILILVALNILFGYSRSSTWTRNCLLPFCIAYIGIIIGQIMGIWGTLHLVKVLILIPILIVIIFEIMKNIVTTPRFTFSNIVDAVVGYILLVLLWALSYFALEAFIPNSFIKTATSTETSVFMDYIYYSFNAFGNNVTVYLEPASNLAKTLSMFEALMSFFYSTIMVSIYVSLYISHQQEEKQA